MLSQSNRLPLYLILPGVAYLLLLCFRAPDARLYWEYAGRLTHRPVTEGYLEWVDHRARDLRPVETAHQLDRVLPPYSGFSSPYPPGALLLFATVRLPFDELHRFSLALGILSSICICVAGLVTIRLARRQIGDSRALSITGLAFTVWIVLTGSFVVTRFDPVVVLLVAVALLAWEARWRWNAGVWLGLGAAMKLWPIFLVPILAFADRGTPPTTMLRTRHALLLGTGTVVGFALPHLGVLAMGTSPANLFDYLTFYADRPPEVESLQANVLAIGHILGIITVSSSFDFGSHNLVTNNWRVMSWLFSLCFVAVYLGTLIGVLRAKNPNKIEVWAMGFVIVALILCSKVFSGEYLIWIMPFGLLAAAGRHWGIVASYAIALILLRLVYWNWDAVISVDPLGTSLVTAKNMACVAMACAFARAILVSARIRSPSLA